MAGEAGQSVTWIAVATHPHRERLAIENLHRQGYATYCPMIRRRITHARRTRDALRPLFPGYLFVDVGPLKGIWRPIQSTFGVRSVVRNGERIARVPDGLIAALRTREIDGVIQRPAAPFKVGQQVRVASGAFDGLVGRIVEMSEKDRLVVLMDLLNQSVRVKLSSGQVEPVR
jgi:transcriptional antiterminator RfaH